MLIPARNEADQIERTLRSLGRQGSRLKVVLVDDQSLDGTAERARKVAGIDLEIIVGKPLPPGWSGKLWALEQGRLRFESETILLVDADIELAPGMVSALWWKLRGERVDLASVMAELRTESAGERLLAPAFVYFFKLLYPFSLGNNPKQRRGVAAGGCVLVKRDTLERIGGFAALKGALIDDCTLAQRIKDHGGATWVGLSHGVRSHRPYPRLQDFWDMVARNAFTQLRYSPVLLLAATFTMLTFFWGPWAGLLSGSKRLRAVGLIGAASMTATYLPMVRFYGLPAWRALTLAPVSLLYLLMTWTSAFRYWQGRRAEWRGRTYKS